MFDDVFFFFLEYVSEASLGESVIFNMMNNGKALMMRINKCIQSGTVITEHNIQEQLIQIERTHISPLASNVVEAFRNGDIVLLHSKEVTIPQAVPFITTKIDGKVKSFVFINKYGNLTQSSQVSGGARLNIQMRDLYSLMEGAYIQNRYNTNPIMLTRNLGLMKLTANVYAAMFVRILNREYALSIDEMLYNRVLYTVTRFYLERVWMCTNSDIIESYSISGILSPDKTDITIVSDSYTNAGIKTITDMVDFLKTLSPRVSTINTRYVVECYINLYHGAAIFGIDCLPYFLFTLTSSLLGSFIVNQPVVADIVKNTKGMNSFYSELAKVFRD